MKKVVWLAIVCMALVACSGDKNGVEGVPFEKGQRVVLRVGMGDSSDEAAGPNRLSGVYNSPNIDFVWEEGDKLLVEVGGNKAVFTMKSGGVGQQEAEFEGTMPEGGNTFTVSYYPGLTDKGAYTTPDISSQTYNANGIPAGKMWAKAENCVVSTGFTAGVLLKPQFSVLQLNFFGYDTINKIVVERNSGGSLYTYTLDCSACNSGKGVIMNNDKANPVKFFVLVHKQSFDFIIRPKKIDADELCEFKCGVRDFSTKGVSLPACMVCQTVDFGSTFAIRWAVMNVGATNITDYGDYFAWGEVATKNDYNWATYKWMATGRSDWGGITKYTHKDGQNDSTAVHPIWYDSEGKFIGDSLEQLLLEDDAAHVNWGATWRMPTWYEMSPIIGSQSSPSISTNTWKTNYRGSSTTGLEVSYNSQTLFLPAAGFMSPLTARNVACDYWSSTVYYQNSDRVSAMRTTENYPNRGNYNPQRYEGESIRPVCPKYTIADLTVTTTPQ